MAFDALRGNCVAFGGSLNELSRDDTWEWNGSVWTERFPPAAPDARVGHAVAFDSGRGVTIVFGGQYCAGFECDTTYGDTWEWDGQSWTDRQIPGPSPRYASAMAYDEARGVTVLYGGFTDEGRSGETWEYDGLSWTLRDGPGPGERDGHAMTYDSDRRVTILFGGAKHNEFRNDMWEWDGATWTEVQTDPGPSPRENAGLVYDSARKTLVLFGGFRTPTRFSDTWEFICAPPCEADLDGNLKLDLFDFLTFVNLFNAADPGADCDQNKFLDLFDFLCFTNAFNAGC